MLPHIKREVLTYAQWALLSLAASLALTDALRPTALVAGLIFFGCLTASTAIARWILFRQEAAEVGPRDGNEKD